MPSSVSIREWLLYSDRNQSDLNPLSDTTIVTERFFDKESGNHDSLDWRREEYLIRSAFIPIDKIRSIAEKMPSPHYLTLDRGWNSEDEFDFGDHLRYMNTAIYPLSILIKHPVTKEYKIELSYKFLTYHALLTNDNLKYYHPIDNILVVDTEIVKHRFYDPSARVTVHRDYLRDFMSATKTGLLISIVADRFANAPSEDDLGIKPIQDEAIDDLSKITTIIHQPESEGDLFQGRSIFHRNMILEPYDAPKFERSPWHFFGKFQDDVSQLPVFIVNSEGKKLSLPRNRYLPTYIETRIGSFGYLYFRPEVLQKYLRVPGFRVFFHMRNWGIASLPGDQGTIDVGINSHGLINAFAPDIAGLNIAEQAYWASFSSLPSGEVCEEMFQTRMQQNPPHSPSVIDLVKESCKHMEDIFKELASIRVFNPIQPNNTELSRLSVGPLTTQYDELLELAKILYGWIIETMEVDSLRKVLNTLGKSIDGETKKLRQIKLIERILIAKGMKEDDARSVTGPLVGLNELRIGAAHIGSLQLDYIFKLMGENSTPKTPRGGWISCVDAVTNSINSIAKCVE